MPEVVSAITSVTEVAADVLVVNLFAGVKEPGGATGAVDQALGGLIAQAIAAGDLAGKLGETALFYTHGRLKARKVLVVGLGKAEKFGLTEIRRAAAMAARTAWQSGASSIATIAHGAGIGGIDPVRAAEATIDGTLYGLYRFSGYKTGEKEGKPEVTQVILVERDEAKARAMESGIRLGRILAESVNWARDLGNRPGNRLTATDLAEEAVKMARETGLEVQVLEREDLERLGANLLLAVNRGSAQPPKMIILRHRGRGGNAPLALVGKGLTFDSGGISIKPTENMWDMKFDMAGGAAVLGAMRAIGLLKPAVDVLAVVPATDNMPDGNSYKPGDVIQGLSGKTVEIRSTDAEGRLILADGLAYAVREGARRIITASTLTGGALIALGRVRFALVASDDAWAEEILRAAEVAGEKAWRLPADEEYVDLFKSNIADMTNGGKREASTIQGGLFLLQHVGQVPTAHLDIAATAWGDGGKGQEPGATGVGTRTIVAAVLRQAREE